jgi:hypothetical protein
MVVICMDDGCKRKIRYRRVRENHGRMESLKYLAEARTVIVPPV